MGVKHKTTAPEERAQREKDMRTQGAKACRAPRINAAFSADNYDYINTVSRVKGVTMTKFVNSIIAQHRAEHGALYEAAKKVIEEAEKAQEAEEEKAQEAAGEEGSK